MFRLIRKIKDIKTLALTHLQQLRDESQILLKNNDAILNNQATLLSNDAASLAASVHLVEMMKAQSQEQQRLYTEVLAQIQLLQEQQQQYRDTLLSMVFRVQPQLIATTKQPLFPDVALMIYLYSFLPSRKALDIGANIGEVSWQLLQAGYEVYAFEPFPPVFTQLKQNFAGRSNFHPMEVAIGSADGRMDLHLVSCLSEDKAKYADPTVYSTLKPRTMPEDLPFTDTVQVEVRSLQSLHQSQELPTDIGLVKIDTEGFDLEVMRGMGSFKYPVIIAEFWDEQHSFQALNAKDNMILLEHLVEEMRQREYHWYIVISRDSDTREITYYCNYAKTPSRAWGNVFFFQSHEVFSYALKWCSSVLQPTYFVS